MLHWNPLSSETCFSVRMEIVRARHRLRLKILAQLRTTTDLLADAELLNNGFVALGVVGFKVIEQAPTLTHQHQKPAPGSMILFVRLKVLGQTANAFAQDGNLNLRAASVAFMRAVEADNLLFLLLR